VLRDRADDAEIEATLAADSTATGQQSAARARATVPTAEAKREAFDRLVGSDDAPNAIVRATTLGFQHVNDPESLAPLVGAYFDALLPLWAQRSYHIAEALATRLYPAPLASTVLRDPTPECLDPHAEP